MSNSSVRAGRRRASPLSLDVVLCAPRGRHLAVLLVRDAASRSAWTLPWTPLDASDPFDDQARSCATEALGARPAWLTQVGTFGATKRHPGVDVTLSVAYAGVTPARAFDSDNTKWFASHDLPTLAPRHRAMIEAAIAAVRERMDLAPVAFRMLPETFTLSELQDVYELLLGRRLHKASFRRALLAARLVAPTDEWRTEGRGRPAQLFSYAPKKRRMRRPVRFELLGG